MRSILILATAALLGGCTQMTLHEGKQLADEALTGGGSAQFRDVVVSGRRVCGQINVTDRYGVATGYKGFIVDLDAHQVVREPSLPSDAAMTPVQHAFLQLDQDMSLMDFSAASFQACGKSVASPEAEAAKQALTRHFGMAMVPRLEEH